MDIVERLRKMVGVYIGDADIDDDLNNAADEIERLREALIWIERHPVEESKQWEVAVKEMKRLARSALQQKNSE